MCVRGGTAVRVSGAARRAGSSALHVVSCRQPPRDASHKAALPPLQVLTAPLCPREEVLDDKLGCKRAVTFPCRDPGLLQVAGFSSDP